MTIPGYTLIAPISEDRDFVFYRATRMLDDMPVLLKVPATAHLSPRIFSRLAYEYELARDFDPDRIARPLALERHGSQAALVLEQGPTKVLASLLGSPMDIQRFLRIAIGITAALGELHEHALVHKDIKPENVLLDDDGHVLLTGLGIASRLPIERQAPEPPEVIAGTLAYMAPEQTGRMNRSIDSRSDLYALGITFYQMLTGVLPFTANDPMELVHCHIARQPVPPIQKVSSLPEPLSEIVMKLLSKTGEERYQSTIGLNADLRRCLAAWASKARIDPFPLGEHDVLDRLLIPERLYGRKPDIDALHAAFDRVVASGIPEIVLVSGYSGIGKTSVVHELHKALVPSRGLFAAGKFDQYKRDVPYATLVQALQSLVRHILGKSEAEVERWRDVLQKAVNPNGQLIVSLIPEVELIIGQQPPVPDLPPREARIRFQMVLLRFIGAFAGAEHPLVLFLDDLQWLDAATLDLLAQLTTESKVRGLLLIGAYRDNEVTPAHPLMRTIEAIRKGGASVQDIVLAPLTVDDTCCLVADSLLCDRERALPLAQLLHKKTGGNPFFAIQFLTALTEETLLAFDPVAGGWTWDLARIRARNYTDNVVHLMTEKLRRLPVATQEALKQLACLGNVAEIDTLAAVHGKTEEAMRAALRQAVLAGLVYQQHNTCKFLHDRIQQAAYSLIPESRRAEVHLRIGRALLARMPAGHVTGHLFDIANHLNRGAALLTHRDEKAQVAEIDLRAGRKAKTSAAYASACVYLAAGMDMLDESDWESRYELTFNLWLNRAECEFLTGNFDAAERLIEVLLQRGASKVDCAAAYHLKVQVHVLKSENPQAVDSALACLRLFGIDIPAHPSPEQVQAEYDTMWRTLKKRPIESLIDLPLMTDPELLAAMQVLSVLLGPAYFTDIQLHRLHLCRMVNLSIQHGISGPSAHGCGFLGFILGPAFHRYGEAYRFGKLACDIAEKYGFLAYKARTYVSMALIALWTQPIKNAVDFNRIAFRTAIETGSPEMACYSLFHLLADLFLRNDPLDTVWHESEIALNYVRKAKFHDVADIIVSKQRFIAAMQGRTAALSTFSDAQFDEAAFEAGLTADRMPMLVSLYWIIKLKARYLSGDYAEVLAAAETVKPMLWAAAAHIHLLDYFLYTALAVTALYGEACEDKRTQWRDLLAEHLEQLREWAENYPPNFADKHALLSAEIARIDGRDMEAMRLYDQAIHAAQDNDFVQQESLAAEVASRFYEARGFDRIAETYLRIAHAGYARWGADGKVRQLEQLHLRLAQTGQPQTVTLTEHLDALSVAKAQRAISGEIHPDRLARTLLRIVMESAGAQTGYLSVEGAGQLWAKMQPDDNDSPRIVFDASPPAANIPEAIINYVHRSRKAVVLSDAGRQGGKFFADDYLHRVKPKSVLCMAIQRQEKLLAVLYLENNLVSGAFTPGRRTVLEVLSAQAAISLETAAVYKKLQESEERWRMTLEAMHIGIFDWDVAHDSWYTSPEYYTMLGYKPKEDLTGDRKEWLERVHPDDRAHVKAKIREVLARAPSLDQSQEYTYEARIRHADGTYRWQHVKGYGVKHDQEGRVTRILGTRMDIHERRQAEEEIAWNLATNQMLSSLYIPIVTAGTTIEQIADAVLEKSRQLTSSRHGYVAEIDPANGDLIAHTHTKMLQTACRIAEDKLRKIRFPRKADGLYNGLWGHALNTKEPFFTNMPAKHPASIGIPEGHLVIKRFLTVPVLLAGELVGQISLSNSTRAYSDRDLDAVIRIAEFFAIAIQHKRVEVEIQMLNQELEQRVLDRTAELAAANKELEAFAYSVSHDLRAPVRHIGGFLELLQKSAGTALNKQSRHYMDNISGAAQKMGLLIDDLLSFSRMGRHAMSSQKVALGSLVDDVIRELEPEAADRAIDWRIGDLPTVGGDAAMLRMVLVNLIANALKFTRIREQARIEIGSVPGQGSEAVICVRDNGVGFDMAYADKLFGVFQRLHRSDEFEGTGIGLANVRRIIARHGGRTWGEGNVDQGAAFYFTLPHS